MFLLILIVSSVDKVSKKMNFIYLKYKLSTYQQTNMSKARDILGTDRDTEFLQSFVRIGIQADEEDNAYKSVYMQTKPDTNSKPDLTKQISEGKSDGTTPRKSRYKDCILLNMTWFSCWFLTRSSITPDPTKKKRKSRVYFDEVYTDKDRAAAVSHGKLDSRRIC